MMTWTRTLRRVVGLGAPKAADEDVQRAAATARRQAVERPPIDLAPNDPLLACFAESRGAVSLDELQLESAAVQALRARGSKLVVPLISQGELIGLLDLGPRLSDQEYSREDRGPLADQAATARPAARRARPAAFATGSGDRPRRPYGSRSSFASRRPSSEHASVSSRSFRSRSSSS